MIFFSHYLFNAYYLKIKFLKFTAFRRLALFPSKGKMVPALRIPSNVTFLPGDGNTDSLRNVINVTVVIIWFQRRKQKCNKCHKYWCGTLVSLIPKAKQVPQLSSRNVLFDKSNKTVGFIYTRRNVDMKKQHVRMECRLDLSSPQTQTSAIGCTSLHYGANSLHLYVVARNHRLNSRAEQGWRRYWNSEFPNTNSHGALHRTVLASISTECLTAWNLLVHCRINLNNEFRKEPI